MLNLKKGGKRELKSKTATQEEELMRNLKIQTQQRRRSKLRQIQCARRKPMKEKGTEARKLRITASNATPLTDRHTQTYDADKNI